MVSLILPNFNSSCFYRIVSKSAVILLSSGKPFHLDVIDCLYLTVNIFFLYLKKVLTVVNNQGKVVTSAICLFKWVTSGLQMLIVFI